ncbi:MAG TPA: Maf family protein [Ignavibacteriaceae bacterium]|nr:Maf family protein [Ignavibacteriaceae bacterium]
MIKSNLPIYLASKSPRRKRLLKQLNLKFKIVNADIEENFLKGELPMRTVKRLALEKLFAAKVSVKKGIIITADTIVVIDGQIIGKPVDAKDAKRILRKLSGRTHIVYTGFTLHNTDTKKTITGYERTNVTFRNLTAQEIIDYISTGSPMDKAGAYGIQDDFGAVFVKKICGDYYNVVGLPLTKLYQALLKVI